MPAPVGLNFNFPCGRREHSGRAAVRGGGGGDTDRVRGRLVRRGSDPVRHEHQVGILPLACSGLFWEGVTETIIVIEWESGGFAAIPSTGTT